jgi:antitoxin component YwqK of YwqJK toxin-antitoxin module|tara:strand:+ start:620 stop:1159 length:540 start_codon:yes stop_codon:yes gene_type:complete
MNKSITLLVFAFVACSSKTPVDMEEVLYDRSGQYITADNYNTSIIGFLYNQKVYNGPGFIRYRSGEKREQGPLKNGFRSGLWTGWDKKGNKKFSGEYKKGKAHGNWDGFHPNGKKKYEGKYELGFQTGKWNYYDLNGKKNLEENYFVCDDECKDLHPPDRRGVPYVCAKLGRLKESKKN